jgi:integrase
VAQGPQDAEVRAFVASWRPRTVGPEVARFAREAVGPAAPRSVDRAKALLWSCGQLGAFAESVGLELRGEVVLTEAVIECFVARTWRSYSPATRRTLRTNLRALSRALGAPGPRPASLSRERSKAPYTPSEIAGFLALADAQPTEARRQRANGIVCLGAGAGLTGADLRAVTGRHVVARSGGVVVVVTGRRARIVPVLASFADRVLAAGAHAGDDYIVGGVESHRRNVTSRLIASLSGAGGLPRLELPRLRATWLSTVGEAIGLATFMAAAGVTCTQRLGDVVSMLDPGDEAVAVARLGGAR